MRGKDVNVTYDDVTVNAYHQRDSIACSSDAITMPQREIGTILPSQRDSIVEYSHLDMLHVMTSYFDNKY